MVLTLIVLVLCLAGSQTPGETQTSPPGIMLQTQNVLPIPIPAGAHLARLNQVVGSVPSNMSGTVMTRVIAYLTPGAGSTTCTVAINPGLGVSGASTSAVLIPRTATKAIALEQETEALPGMDLSQSIAITAGTQGPCTLLPWSSLTVLAIPPVNEQGYFGY